MLGLYWDNGKQNGNYDLGFKDVSLELVWHLVSLCSFAELNHKRRIRNLKSQTLKPES